MSHRNASSRTRTATAVEKAKKDEPKPLVAADLLKTDHPLHQPLVSWMADKGKELVTRRQARKFLAEFPHYRAARAA